MNWSANKYISPKTAITILAVNHLMGAIGLNSCYHIMFENISWLNLLVSFVAVIAYNPTNDKRIIIFSIGAFFMGMAVEILGVNTGQPFGHYYYTEKFGWQIFGVPLIIGINWILLAYVCGNVAQKCITNKWLAATAAALSMALMDVLLEPFAIRHGLWVWQQGLPPLQNYVAWFAVSLIIQFGYSWLLPNTPNKMAWRYLLLLLVFLAVDLCIGHLKPL